MKLVNFKNKKLPNTPGVYFFLGKNKKVLYVGKAGSLRDRVRSYFAKDIFITRGPAIEQMVREAKDVAFEKTDSVLEALILEAERIKKHKPKYNVREKDDTSFNYVVITDEDFPRVLLVRGRNLLEIRNLKFEIAKRFGPFPKGGDLKEALRVVRKIFPYRDKCRTNAEQMQNERGKPCFDYQLGLCPGTCTGEISKKEYQKTVRNIRLLFEGKKGKLIKTLEQEMKQAARAREFERATELRNKIFSLKHIQDVSLIKPTTYNLQPITYKIEAYDVAHLMGEGMVGVMTVVENGEVNKNEYRKFTLKTIKTADDTGALKEIFERRLRHREWRFPDLIVVDGGKAQIRVVDKLLQGQTLERVINIVGVVKDEYHRPKRIEGKREVFQKHEREILLANSEAHRFAIAFHRKKLRKKAFGR